jgi:hypothetical protein
MTRLIKHGLDDGDFIVDQNTPFMSHGLFGVVRVLEIDVGDAFVGISRHFDGEVAETLKLGVYNVLDGFVRSVTV